MKQYLWMVALAATLAFAPISIATYAHAEDGYSDVESDVGNGTDEEMGQVQDEGQWMTDEPTDDGSEAYDPEAEDSQEPAN